MMYNRSPEIQFEHVCAARRRADDSSWPNYKTSLYTLCAVEGQEQTPDGSKEEKTLLSQQRLMVSLA